MLKFIHCADIHLDSPLRGLERYPGAPVDLIRGATRQAFENLISLALQEEIDAMVIAGDLYDGDWKDYHTGLFFVHQMLRLREAEIPVYIVLGNHDAESNMTRSLQWPDNVHVFRSSRPEVKVNEKLGIAVHGQSFASRAVSADLSEHYLAPLSALFNIGVLHTSADGREGHASYAPTTSARLSAKGYEYWALGHVHKREVLQESPWIVFPGNLQGRHVRETGEKGCTLITVDNGQVLSVQHRPVDVLRWENARVSLTGCKTPDAALERVSRAMTDAFKATEGRPLAMRIEVGGACQAHRNLHADGARWIAQVQAQANEISRGMLWLEQVRLKTSDQVDLEVLIQREDALGSLLRTLTELDKDSAAIDTLSHLFDDLAQRLPAELSSGDFSIDLKDPALLRDALEDVRALLFTRLIQMGDDT